MPTRRLPDDDRRADYEPICRHPEHNPPNMMVFEPGTYEHTCPACHEVTIFTVRQPSWSSPVVTKDDDPFVLRRLFTGGAR